MCKCQPPQGQHVVQVCTRNAQNAALPLSLQSPGEMLSSAQYQLKHMMLKACPACLYDLARHWRDDSASNLGCSAQPQPLAWHQFSELMALALQPQADHLHQAQAAQQTVLSASLWHWSQKCTLDVLDVHFMLNDMMIPCAICML